MKINLKQAVRDYEGQPMMVPDREKIQEMGDTVDPSQEVPKKELTFFEVFLNALNGEIRGEPPVTSELKSKIYHITKKMYSNAEPDFTPDQLEVIKDRVGRAYSALVYGRVCDLISGEVIEAATAK